MRRILFAGILFAAACVKATAPSAVATIEVQSNVPASGVFPGDQVQLNADAIDMNGAVLPVTLTYTSSALGVATVSTTGLITAVAAGQSLISVSGGGTTVHLTLSVDGNVPMSVTVSPSNPTIAVGAQLSLAALATTTLGNPARNKTFTWSSGDATRVSVDQTGKVTALAKTTGVSVCAAPTDSPNTQGCATVIVQ